MNSNMNANVNFEPAPIDEIAETRERLNDQTMRITKSHEDGSVDVTHVTDEKLVGKMGHTREQRKASSILAAQTRKNNLEAAQAKAIDEKRDEMLNAHRIAGLHEALRSQGLTNEDIEMIESSSMQAGLVAFTALQADEAEQADAAKKLKLKEQRTKSYEKSKGKRAAITKQRKYTNALELIAAMRAEQALEAVSDPE